MGSSSSLLGPRPSRPRVNRRMRRLRSFFCGGSSSHAPLEMEDPAEMLVNSAESCNPLVNVPQNLAKESCSLSGSGTEVTNRKPETGSSSESSIEISEDTSVEGASRNFQTSIREKCFYETKELVASHQSDVGYGAVESCPDTGSTSSKEHHSPAPASINVKNNMGAVNDSDNSVNGVVSRTFPGAIHSSSSSPQELGDLSLDGVSVENHGGEVVTIHNSDSNNIPVVSDSPAAFQSQRDESVQEAATSGLGFLVSDRERGRRDGSVLHVDVVSISSILSSSTAEISNHEARRNSRRLFWDAFSRRSSRRHRDSPTIVFSMDDTDDLGSRDRWLLDFSGDFLDDGIGGDSGYLSSRFHSTNERRWHSRSEMWERLRSGLDETGRRTSLCPSGLHPDGTCSCQSFLMAEESGTRASISRIVMLAEALFEVLDEIHRQPVSLSLSMVSLPAPESLVDSFPLKSHKKDDTARTGDDAEQCYICLAEYEDGDKIRVLPCHHEYHMSCVDKWLKEIHGVCPLCRGDVRDGNTEGSVSNSEIPPF